MHDSIFVALYKTASSKPKNETLEDYIVDCFVLMINWMLIDKQNKLKAVELLNYLCFKEIYKDIFTLKDDIQVNSHLNIKESGNAIYTDILVRSKSASKYICVEAKWDSPIKRDQLNDYIAAMKFHTQYHHHSLVSLSKKLKADYGPADLHRTWEDIYNKINDLYSRGNKPMNGYLTTKYLIESFLAFLKYKDPQIDRFTEPYSL